MKVSVWDTYLKRKDGKIMHFDILVPNTQDNEKSIIDFGKDYLKSKNFATEALTTEICNFCHIEQATDAIIHQIEKKGYSIIEMENCN